MKTRADLVARSLTEATAETFATRVREQAATLRERLEAGDFDNRDFAVGMELEVYGASTPTDDGRLSTLAADVFDPDGVSKELGLHNAEVNTEPVALRPNAFDAQATELRDSLAAARDRLESDTELVLDAMWTQPPPAGSVEYLSAHDRQDGLTFAQNMRSDPRYHAIDNDVLRRTDGEVPLSVAGTSRTFPTILYESLATSIQPHVQIPDVTRFPAYFNAAIRTLGPLLALAANSPFLPPDLYTDVDDPVELVDATPQELRIAVFEQSVNHTEHPKVRVPRDLDDATDVVDRIVEDDCYAPFLAEWTEDSADSESEVREAFPELEHKRGTYWRWVRAVIGGEPVSGAGDERSIRIEYRPLPTQPTVADVVGFQALTAGLLRGLVAVEHPIGELPWEAACESFYAAADAGLDADLAWIDENGARTTDPETIFDEVFTYARHGLAEQGFDEDRIDELLGPIEYRWTERTTPSDWKQAQVRTRLADGADLASAICGMQREYCRRSRETRSFAEWR